MVKVLLVEDDSQISKSLSMNLNYSGFDVATADTVATGWTKFTTQPYDIVLLDVNLPDGNGIELCHRIRTAGKNTPILFLSARTDEETVVKGMNFGGDDYIRKPFGMEELKVRINKILKRAGPPRDVIEAGPLSLDLEKRAASLLGQPLSLGKREFDILSILVKKAGDVVTRDHVLASLDQTSEVYDRTIDSHISHLRRKIREISQEQLQIVSVYGVGYRLQWKAA